MYIYSNVSAIFLDHDCLGIHPSIHSRPLDDIRLHPVSVLCRQHPQKKSIADYYVGDTRSFKDDKSYGCAHIVDKNKV